MATTQSSDVIIREIVALRHRIAKLGNEMHEKHGVSDCTALDEVYLGLNKAQKQFLALKAEHDRPIVAAPRSFARAAE